jgi:hypothetical protein
MEEAYPGYAAPQLEIRSEAQYAPGAAGWPDSPRRETKLPRKEGQNAIEMGRMQVVTRCEFRDGKVGSYA